MISEDQPSHRRPTLAVHVTMRPSDDRGLSLSPAGLREVARVLLREPELLGFRVADTHMHVLVSHDREGAGRFAQRVQSALKQRLALPVSFEAARHRPVSRRRHLWNALRYVIRQEEHHGTDFDLAQDGSVLPDLLGMRVVASEALRRRGRALLPRLSSETLRFWSGLELLDQSARDPALLVDAAAAAFALPDLCGNDSAHWQARRAAAQAVDSPTRTVAALLQLSPRTVQRLRKDSAARAHLRAVDLQLRHRTALASRAGDW